MSEVESLITQSDNGSKVVETPEKDVYQGKSTIVSSLLNQLNSIIGVGVMTLPYCLQTDGYIMGFMLFTLCGWLAHIAFKQLAVAAEFTGHYQYKEIAEILFGHRAWGIVIPVIMIVYVSGSLASYSISLMDNMFWWQEDSDRKYRLILCVAIMYLIILPLSCLRNLDFLKYNSYITMICETFIVFVIIYYFTVYDEPREAPVPFKSGLDVISTIPLISASMCGHFATPYVYKELKNRSQKKMDIVIILNGIVLFAFYTSIMFFGYFTFTSNVHSDLLKTIALHSKNAWYLKAANVAMLILIISHFPVTCFGCRAAVESLVFKNKKAPMWGTILITTAIVTFLMTISLFVTEIADVLDVTSSLGGSFVIFIIPAALAMSIIKKEKQSWQNYIIPVIMVILGLFMLIGGITSSIVRWI
ncbi:Amino_acid transporter [Hexamita inflata]|uniref:Putative n=1 Tax=Hexamita inflata TaxID=28002 RepID=A0ABP1H718_9EUKA